MSKPAITDKTLALWAEQPYRTPESLSVAGGDDEFGKTLAGTFLDDNRQNIAWGPEHESMLRAILLSAEFVRGLFADDKRRRAAVTPESVVTVYLLGTDDEYHAVVENGRQRERVAKELNSRVEYIKAWCERNPSAHTLPQIRKGLTDLAKEHDGLYWCDGEFLRAVFGSEDLGSTSDHTWIERKKVKHAKVAQPGDAVTVDTAIDGGDQSDASGATNDASAHDAPNADGSAPHVVYERVPYLLKVSVAGCNPDAEDPATLVRIMGRQENGVKTPQVIRAQNFARIKATPAGAKMSNAAIGDMMGLSGDVVANDLKFLSLIPEVQQAVESGRVSFSVVVSGGGKHGCMFVRADDGNFVALGADIQGKIWALLSEEFPPDADGEFSAIKGAKGKKAGLRIQKLVLTGKADAEEVAPAAGDDAAADAADGVSNNADDSGGATGTADGGASGGDKPAKPKAKKMTFDAAVYSEHFQRAISRVGDPDENGLRDSEIRDRAERRAGLMAAEAVLKFVSGDKSALASVPADLRDACLAAVADSEKPAPAPAATEAQVVETLILTALAGCASGGQPSEITGSLDDGSQASDSALASAKLRMAELIAEHAAAGDGTDMYDFISAKFLGA